MTLPTSEERATLAHALHTLRVGEPTADGRTWYNGPLTWDEQRTLDQLLNHECPR